MMIPVETLKLIQETAVEAKQVKHVLNQADGRTAVYAVRGELTDVPLDPPPRKHEVRTLEQLISYANTLGGPAVIWHDDESVVLIPDDADRRDRVTFPLSYSKAFAKLLEIDLAGVIQCDQKGFIRLMRNTLGVPEAEVVRFRKLDWESKIRTRGEAQRNRESLGKDIEAEVQGTGELPEDMLVNVPIYAEVGERTLWTIRLLIEYDVAQTRILVCPEPEALMEVLAAHQGTIAERIGRGLKGKNVRVYYGRP